MFNTKFNEPNLKPLNHSLPIVNTLANVNTETILLKHISATKNGPNRKQFETGTILYVAKPIGNEAFQNIDALIKDFPGNSQNSFSKK